MPDRSPPSLSLPNISIQLSRDQGESRRCTLDMEHELELDLLMEFLAAGCPPPPVPPQLDTSLPALCKGDCASLPMVASLDSVQDIFHSVIIVIVSSLVIVISLLLAAVFLWR
jgi:hypothetical protein